MRRLWKPLARRLQQSARKALRNGLQTRGSRLEALEQRQMLSISATDDAFAVTSYATGTPTTVAGNVRANDVAGTGAFLLNNPSHGSLGTTFQSSGSFTYTPTANYTGSDSFSYMLVDATETRAKVTDLDTVPDVTDAFGDAVAVSGEWAVVGAKWDDEAGQNAGAAYVFHWENADWKQKQKLVPSSISTDANFGYSVSIDGSHILIGAPYDNANSKAQSGSVYAYEFDGVSWANPQKLTLNSAVALAGDWFGNSVDVDGNLAVIGAPQRDDNSLANSGSAYVFGFSTAGSWSYGTQLNPNSSDRGAGDLFGMSVAVDANRVVVGADGDDTNTGSAFVFDYATSWSQTAKLVASDRAAGDLYGWSVGVSGDRVIVGAREKTVGAYTKAGEGYLYEKSGSSWTETKLFSGESQSDVYFGWAVGIDGDTVVVGGYGYDQASLQNVGAAYVYRKLNGVWPQANKLVSSLGQANVNGAYSVAAIDGDLIISGIPFATTVAVNFGSVAFFRLYQDIGTVNVNVLPSSTAVAAVDDRFTLTEGGTTSGANVLTNDLNGTTAGAYVSRQPTTGAITSFNEATGAFTYSVAGATASNFFGTDAFTYTLKKLTERKKSGANVTFSGDSSVEAGALFGFSVAMDGDVAVIGAPYEDNGAVADVGAIYIFRWNGQDWAFEHKIWGAASGDLFGYDLDINRGRIVVGAFLANSGGLSDSGAAYVFEYDGKAWPASISSPGAYTLTEASPGASYWFGRSVDIWQDTVVVGAPNDPLNGVNSGAAYVFNWTGGGWSAGTVLNGATLGHSAYDNFGQSVAVEGNRIVVGAINDAANVAGAVYVFEGDSGIWSPKARLTTGNANDQFGWSVDLSGSFIAVGARYFDQGGDLQTGAAYVYQGSGTSWTPMTLTLPDLAPSDYFGYDVKIEGDTLVIGAYQDDTAATNAGAVYVYRYDGTSWTKRHTLTSGTATNVNGGFSVAAIWGDNILMGIPWDSSAAANAGAVSFFELQNASVLLTVLPGANSKPALTKFIDDVTVVEDSPNTVLQLATNFTDPDVAAGDTVTFSVTSNSNTALVTTSFLGSALILDYQDDKYGQATITVLATDAAGLTDQDTFVVTVNAANALTNDLPQVGSLKDSRSVVGRGQAFTLTASKVSAGVTAVNFYRDSNATLQYDAGDQLLGKVTSANGNGEWILNVLDTVTATFEDGRQTYFAVAASGAVIGLPARAFNEVFSDFAAPVIQPIEFDAVREHQKYSYQVRATQKDGHALTYALSYVSAPPGVTGTPPTPPSWIGITGTGLITVTDPTGLGEHVFMVTVSDSTTGGKVATATFACRCIALDTKPDFVTTELSQAHVYGQKFATLGPASSERHVFVGSTGPDNPHNDWSNSVDFTFWFNDFYKDAVHGVDPQPTPAKDITLLPLGISLPAGLQSAVVQDDVRNYKGLHVWGTLLETFPYPTSHNITLRVQDPDNNYRDVDFYVGVDGWLLREDDPDGSPTPLKGLASRDIFYARQEDLTTSVPLTVQANDYGAPPQGGVSAGSTVMDYPSAAAFGSGLSAGPNGTILFSPSPDFYKNGYDYFEYSYKVPLNGAQDYGPGSYWYTNKALVTVLYYVASASSDEGPSCGCGTPAGAATLKIADGTGTAYVSFSAGGGGSSGSCTCGAGGADRSPDDPGVVWNAPAELTPLLTGTILGSAFGDGPSWPKSTAYEATYSVVSTPSIPNVVRYYDGAQIEPGETVAFSEAVDVTSLGTGVYNYGVTVRAGSLSNGTFTPSSGQAKSTYNGGGKLVVIKDRPVTEFGRNWNLNVLDRLVVFGNGTALVQGDGATYFFPSGNTHSAEDPLYRTLGTAAGNYTITFKDQSKQVFNSNGMLLSWQDRLGNTTTFQWQDLNTNGVVDKADGIKKIIDYAGREMVFTYSGLRVISIEDYAHRITTLGYDIVDPTLLTSVREHDPDTGSSAISGDLTTFAYGTAGQPSDMLSRITSPDGEEVGIFYDNLRRAFAVVGTGDIPISSWEISELAGKTTTLAGSVFEGTAVAPAPARSYSSSTGGGIRGRRIDALGFVTEYFTDSLGLTVEEADPTGKVTSWRRNGAGLITRLTESNGGSTDYRYDSKLNLIGQTLPDGTQRTWSYDATYNRVTDYVDDSTGAQRKTHFQIDAVGNVASMSQVVGNLDGVGNSETDDLKTAYVYTTANVGAYIPAGLVKSVTDPLGRVTELEYFSGTGFQQQAGRVKTITRAKYTPDVSATQYLYDAAGNVIQYTDELQRTTLYYYDDAGRLETIVLPDPSTGGPLGPRISYTYSTGQRVATVTDQNNLVTSYEYNRFGDVERVLEPDPDGGGDAPARETWFLDNRNGWSATVIEAAVMSTAAGLRDRISGTDYDKAGRVLREISPPPRPAVYDTIIDNTASGFVPNPSGSWATIGGLGYGGNYRSAAKGTGSATATWTFGSLTVGKQYEVLVTWRPETTAAATDAPFTVTPSGGTATTVRLDERAWPGGHGIYGDRWQSLGFFASTGTSLTVSLSNAANGNVLADAVRVVEVSPTTQFGYDGDLVNKVTDPLGRSTQYIHDPRGQLTAVFEPAPDVTQPATYPITRFEYNALGELTKTTDPLGRVTQQTYDALGRISKTILPYADSTGTKIDDANPAANGFTMPGAGWFAGSLPGGEDGDYQYATATTAVAQWKFTDIDPGKEYEVFVTWVKDPTYPSDPNNASNAPYVVYDGAETDTAFPQVLVNQKKEPRSATLGEGWYSLGVYPASKSTMTVRLSRLTTTNGQVVADAVRLVEAQSDTVYTYDKDGNLVSTTDALGRLTQYAYDSQNRLVRLTAPDPDGIGTLQTSPVTQYTFDAAGELKKVRDPLGRETTYQYDYLGRLTQTDSPDPDFDGPDLAPQTRYFYDPADNLLATRDRLGQMQVTTLDRLYRPVAQTDPQGGVTKYVLDGLGNVLSLTDPVGNVTAWTYDPLDRAITETNPLGTRLYEYDDAGNLVKKTDRLNRVVNYQYDGLNRLKSEQLTGGAATTYGYDLAGQLLSVVDAGAAYAYQYDAQGRLTKTTASGIPGLTGTAYVLDQTFDNLGNRKRLSATVLGNKDLRDDYTYDALSQLTKLTQQAQGTGAGYNAVSNKRVDFGYDAAGQWQSINRYSDLAGTSLVALTNFAYDRNGRLTGLSHERNNSQIAGYQYAYDPASRLTRIDSSIDEVSQFTYDRTGQLTGAQNTFEKDEAYAYDANGNRTGSGYSTGTANRLLSDGVYDYHYDAEGNRDWRVDKVSGDREDYTWDYRNRLVKVVFKGKDTSGVLQQTGQLDYTYDAFDRLVKRSLDKTTPFDGADAALEYYGYDGEDLLFDISDADGPSGSTYSPAIKHRYLHGPAVDQILAQETVGGETLWMLTDHQGSVRDLVRNDGTIAAHYQYDSFGKPLDGLENVTRFGYAGYERDSATGYYKTDTRWYDPQTGKWTSEDPIGFAGGDANLSRYVGNGAANFVDSAGTAWWNPWTQDFWFNLWGDPANPPAPVDDAVEKYGDPRDINVLLDELEHRGKAFSSIDGLELNHKRAKNEIIANSMKAGVCDAAANTLEAAIFVASIPLPGPEDAIVWAWAAKRGFTLVGKPGSYALVENGRKLTGEAVESAAELIFDFAQSKGFSHSIRNGHLAGKLHPVTQVPFNKYGFPDFSAYATKQVQIVQTGNRARDFAAANKAAGLECTPQNYIWHHHEDLTTMQLVPDTLHYQTGHTGGVSILKNKK